MSILLPFNPNAPGLAAALEELDDWKRRIDLKGPLPRMWEGRLRRDLEAEATAASVRMEGVPVTVEEVRRILAGDPTVRVREEDHRLVSGYRDAMSFVTRRADDANFHWQPELIIGIHDRVMGGRYQDRAGRLRGGQAWLVNSATGQQVFLPPPAEDVPGLLARVTDEADTWSLHPALLAGWIHIALAAAHPFRDGNGRVARILASLAMHRGTFKRREFTSLEEWWGRHRQSYYRSFECLGKEFDEGTETTPFIEVHVQAQLSQVRALDLRERTERLLWTVLEDLVADLGLPTRVSNALWEVFFGREVAAGYYRSLTDISRPTATSDLLMGTAAGLLSAHGERRGRRYVAANRLFELVGERLGIQVQGIAEEQRGEIVAELSRRALSR